MNDQGANTQDTMENQENTKEQDQDTLPETITLTKKSRQASLRRQSSIESHTYITGAVASYKQDSVTSFKDELPEKKTGLTFSGLVKGGSQAFSNVFKSLSPATNFNLSDDEEVDDEEVEIVEKTAEEEEDEFLLARLDQHSRQSSVDPIRQQSTSSWLSQQFHQSVMAARAAILPEQESSYDIDWGSQDSCRFLGKSNQ